MTLRPVQPADRGALLALWNRSVRYDPLTPALLDEKVWQDEGFRPGAALVLEDGRAIAGFGMAVVRPADPAPRGYVKLLTVAPEHRRQGWGGRMLEALETAVCDQGAGTMRVAEAAPNYLVPGLDVRYTPGLLFFEKHGYERFGETYNLTVDFHGGTFGTTAREEELAAKGVTVRRAEADDEAPMAAFLEKHWAAWQGEVGATFRNKPVSLHLALRDGNVLGFSAYDANNVGTGWFGPMGTAPAARGLGIGGVLLRRCLRDLKAQGLAEAVIPWVGPVGFYAHHAGAYIARVFYRYEKGLG